MKGGIAPVCLDNDGNSEAFHNILTSTCILVLLRMQGFMQNFFLGGGTLVCGKVDQLRP